MIKIRIGIFPCDLEAVLADKKNLNFEFVYLTAKNSVEENWVKSFVSKKNIVYYNLAKNKSALEKNSFTDIFSSSNVATVIKNNKLKFLWLTVNNDDRSYLKKWAQKNKVKIVGPEFNLQSNLENKIWFDLFLTRNQLPKPASQIYQPKTDKVKLKSKLVLQSSNSAGGEGTFFLNNKKEIASLIKAKKIILNKKYLLRQLIQGKPFGITIFVAPKIIALSALRLQCYQNSDSAKEKMFKGIQWLPTSRLKINKKDINKIFSQLGQKLYEEKFLGFANVDFIVDKKGKIFILECNPRFSSATVQLIKFPQLISGVPTGQLFVTSFLNQNKYPKQYKFYPMPKINFTGSVLNIDLLPKKTLTINKEFTKGVYKLTKGKIEFKTSDIKKLDMNQMEFIFMSMTKKGEKYSHKTNIGSIISNYSLFTNDGKINQAGKKLLNTFKNYA
ncbi:MAG: ATP-grasp domain-containing protein [Patescibacteria group bacterium]